MRSGRVTVQRTFYTRQEGRKAGRHSCLPALLPSCLAIVSSQMRCQRIVHASILCTGALSACIFAKTERGTMRGIAIEGLFPPHRPLSPEMKQKLTTRAKFIEEVLKSEEFPVGVP